MNLDACIALKSAFILIGLFSIPALGNLALPQGLTDGEQQLIQQSLGFGTSFRPVDNPYPLGGFSGFEFGVSVQSIPTADIGYYGNHATVDKSVVYPLISLGKGILENVDLLFSFLPFNESTGIGIYSGALRWNFFQATFIPATFSIMASATNTNLNNLFISQTVGADIISGVDMEPFAFYVGAGTLYGQAQFSSALTLDGANSNQVGKAFHTVIGVNFSIAELFAAAEVDTYNATIVSFKLGTRL